MEKTETLLIQHTDGTVDEIPLTTEELSILQHSAERNGMEFDEYIMKLIQDFVDKTAE